MLQWKSKTSIKKEEGFSLVFKSQVRVTEKWPKPDQTWLIVTKLVATGHGKTGSAKGCALKNSFKINPKMLKMIKIWQSYKMFTKFTTVMQISRKVS